MKDDNPEQEVTQEILEVVVKSKDVQEIEKVDQKIQVVQEV